MCESTVKVSKKMRAENKAVKLLLDQGYSVHDISMAIGEATVNPGIKIFTRDPDRAINGCIFVSKDKASGDITYGYSSRYANDRPMNPRFATTIAAVRAKLSPNMMLPSKFKNGHRNTAVCKLVERCKLYFQDNTKINFDEFFKVY